MAIYASGVKESFLKFLYADGLTAAFAQSDRVTSNAYDFNTFVTIAKLQSQGVWHDRVALLKSDFTRAGYTDGSRILYALKSPVLKPISSIQPSSPPTDPGGQDYPSNSAAMSWNHVGVGSAHDSVVFLGLLRSAQADEDYRIGFSLVNLTDGSAFDLFTTVLSMEVGSGLNKGMYGFIAGSLKDMPAYSRLRAYESFFMSSSGSGSSLVAYCDVVPTWNKVYSGKGLGLDAEMYPFTTWNNFTTVGDKLTVTAMPQGIVIHKLMLYDVYDPINSVYTLCQAADYPRWASPFTNTYRASVSPMGPLPGDIWENGSEDWEDWSATVYHPFLRHPTVYFTWDSTEGAMKSEKTGNLAINQFFSVVNGRWGHPDDVKGAKQSIANAWTFRTAAIARYELRSVAASWTDDDDGYYQKLFWKFLGDVVVMNWPTPVTIASGSIVVVPAGGIKVWWT